MLLDKIKQPNNVVNTNKNCQSVSDFFIVEIMVEIFLFCFYLY